MIADGQMEGDEKHLSGKSGGDVTIALAKRASQANRTSNRSRPFGGEAVSRLPRQSARSFRICASRSERPWEKVGGPAPDQAF